MRYTLRQLEVFLATAHTANITKAADQLAMSQSAASSALRELEQQFDIQLFDRVGKRLQLNDTGAGLWPKAQALVDQARELERELIQHEDIGHLRLGATLTIGNYLAVELMAEFMARVPHASVSLEVANTASIAAQVLNFDLDVGLIEGEYQHPDLDIRRWRDDELVVFCAPEHPLAAKSALSDQDLIDAQWILRESGSGTRQGFDRAMHGLLSRQTISLELQHTEAIKRAVAAGLGISCLSQIVVAADIARGELVALPVPHRDLHRAFYCVLHKQKYRSAGIQHWLALCGLSAT